MKIVEYQRYDDMVVEFQDEHKAKVHTTYGNFKRSQVRNPYDKTVYGVGYLGEGKYKVYIDQDHLEPVYNVWRTLLGRVCTEKHREQFPAYADCEVCEEWLCYQNFAEWWNKNMYHIGTERMHLDKDILIKGNKIYSPNTCVFTPQNINKLFTKSNRTRGELPIGVYKVNGYDNKYASHFNSCGKLVNLGTFNTIEGAFNAYKEAKEKEIKRVADEYKGKIPQKLYDAMYRYQVEITD